MDNLNALSTDKTPEDIRTDMVTAILSNNQHSIPAIVLVNAQVVRAVCQALLPGFFQDMPPKVEWAFELCRSSRPNYIITDKKVSVRVAGRVPCRIPDAAYSTPAVAVEWATDECLRNAR